MRRGATSPSIPAPTCGPVRTGTSSSETPPAPSTSAPTGPAPVSPTP